MTTKVRSRTELLLWFLLVLVYCSTSRASAQSAQALENNAVQASMKNVMYHYSEPVAVHISWLEGELVPTKAGSIVIFDDSSSFTLVLASAEIGISCNSLAQALNENVFASSDSPIKKVSIQSQNNRLLIKGEFYLKGDVPFETTGSLAADQDGKIRLHTEHIKAAHLPVKGLLDLVGIDLAKLINTNKIRGVAIEKDDLILDPEQILPPPRIQGKVTAVRIEGNDIVQVFGTRQASNFAAKQSGNYVAFRHGDIRFGKLTMHDADLIMIDMDPATPFDFYLDHYQDQLVAGYTKSTPEFGLRVYTRDYNKLRKRARPEQARQ